MTVRVTQASVSTLHMLHWSCCGSHAGSRPRAPMAPQAIVQGAPQPMHHPPIVITNNESVSGGAFAIPGRVAAHVMAALPQPGDLLPEHVAQQVRQELEPFEIQDQGSAAAPHGATVPSLQMFWRSTESTDTSVA
eukprot:jgi/Ulvmu1/5518/UM023_0054.1